MIYLGEKTTRRDSVRRREIEVGKREI